MGIGDPGDTPEDTAGGGTNGLVAEDAEGKHLVLGVRNFRNNMTSYLRLGAAASDAGQASNSAMGEDLAALVHGFTDDTRSRGAGNGFTDTGHRAAVGDDLNQNGALAPRQSLDPNSPAVGDTTLPPARAESKILHTKGGWRDHSDGNRITTTRGDKVEVIRGNYKLVVLGRQDTEWASAGQGAAEQRRRRKQLLDGAAGFDLSGGVQDNGDLSFGMDPEAAGPYDDSDATGHTFNPDPAELRAQDRQHMSVEYEWGPDTDGKWAWKQTTNIGTDDITQLVDGQTMGNYKVITNNYVDYQETNVGSENKYVSEVVNRTYGRKITTRSYATTNDTYQSAETMNTVTTSSVWNDVTEATVMQETKIVLGIMGEIDVAQHIGVVQGSITNTYIVVAPVITNLTVGNAIDLHTGSHLDTHLGIHTDTHVGVHMETHTLLHSDIHALGSTHLDMHQGPHTDVHGAAHVEIGYNKVSVNGDQVGTYTPSGSVVLTSGSAQVRSDVGTAINVAGLTIHL